MNQALKDFFISIPDIMKLKTQEQRSRSAVFISQRGKGVFSRVDMRTPQPELAASCCGARQSKLCAVMQGDTPAETTRGMDIAFVTSLITDPVFVSFKWGALGRCSSLRLICPRFCEMNGPTSHLPRISSSPTTCTAGEEVLNIRASVAYDKSVCACFGAFFARNEPAILRMQWARMSSKARAARRVREV